MKFDESMIGKKEKVNMADKKIWEMLKPEMEKNGLVSEVGSLFGYGSNPIGSYITKVFKEEDFHKAVVLAYKMGQKSIQKKSKAKVKVKVNCKHGHWVPFDEYESELKSGMRVKYGRYTSYTPMSCMVEVGDTGIYDDYGIVFDNPKEFKWVGMTGAEEGLDIWVEDKQ